MDAIETSGLTKDYGAARGLFDLDLTVGSGEIFGYLGPNGAGKTTTIRLLMGLIHPTRGSARVFGLDCQRDSVAVKRRVGYLPGDLAQFGSLRGSEIVAYLAGLRGSVDDRSVRALAERLELDLGRPYREYSRGNKQKLAIVLAFMHAPDLLVLDEPTASLDPLNQQSFYELARETKARGATVFLSSHVLSEVEQVCDRVGILREGRLVTVAPITELQRLRARHVEIEFEGHVPAFEGLPGVADISVDGRRVRFTLQGSFEPVLQAIRGVGIVDLVSREPTLEEIFLRYYGPGAEEGA